MLYVFAGFGVWLVATGRWKEYAALISSGEATARVLPGGLTDVRDNKP